MASTLALGEKVLFRRRPDGSGRVMGMLMPSDDERAAAAANYARLRQWRSAVGALLRRRAAVPVVEFHQLADALGTFVLLAYQGDASITAGDWRADFAKRVKKLSYLLAGIVSHAIPSDEINHRLTYASFELYIEEIDDSWHVRGEGSFGSAMVVVPALRYDAASVALEREAMQTFGRELFTDVFAGDVAALFRESLVRAKGALRIRVWPAGRLAALPWELLHDGHDFLALSRYTPVSRGLSSAKDAPANSSHPLRVLVTLSTPAGTDGIDQTVARAEVEVEETRKRRRVEVEEVLAPLVSLGLLRLDVAPDGSLNAIRRLLRAASIAGRPYNVWHFIGHGIADDATGKTELLVESPDGFSQVADATLLRTLFGDCPELRLVVLNSCHAGYVVTDDSAARAFLDSGVAAAVAMQLEVSDDVAVAFAEEFYGALVDGADIDDAVTEARRAIYFGPKPAEWMTPVLFLRGSAFSFLE